MTTSAAITEGFPRAFMVAHMVMVPIAGTGKDSEEFTIMVVVTSVALADTRLRHTIHPDLLFSRGFGTIPVTSTIIPEVTFHTEITSTTSPATTIYIKPATGTIEQCWNTLISGGDRVPGQPPFSLHGFC